MELFRDETTIALDAVAVACREAFDIHRTAANAVADAKLAASLRELADARERAAEYLANVLCALADGPNRPPEELELLKQAVVWGRALIGGGPASVLELGPLALHVVGEGLQRGRGVGPVRPQKTASLEPVGNERQQHYKQSSHHAGGYPGEGSGFAECSNGRQKHG